MTEIAVQPSFAGGEWSPNLYARVDLAKYKTAVALLSNFFVDYRGGATTRPGTSYAVQAYRSAYPVRVISFQASFNVGYAVEIGNGYMRFHYHGAPVLNTGFAISAVTQANPCVLTVVGNNFAIGDWIYVSGVAGMTQLNGRFFAVTNVAGNLVTIATLNGVALNSVGYTAYSSGGTAASIYTIGSPYTNADNFELIKFSQTANQMILCHPNHGVYTLTLNSPNNWVLIPATFGSTISAPAAPTITSNLAAGSFNYSYAVTSIDSNGQESSASTPGTLASKNDIRTNANTNTITWTAVPGAVGYNIYEAAIVNGAAVVTGAPYGFIGTTVATSFTDSNIAENFALSPPIVRNPFTGFSITSVTVGAPGSYTTVPSVSFGGSPSSPALASVTLSAISTTLAANGAGFAVNDTVTFANGVVIRVTAIVGGGGISTYVVVNPGAITSGATPANPNSQISTSGVGSGATLNINWGVSSVNITNPGGGYSSAPSVTFSAGAASATAVLSPNPINPTVPGFAQQRLALAAPTSAPATFWMSQPGLYFNFNVNNPIQAANAITGTLVTNTLNSIKSIIGSAAGALIFTDKAVFLANGGSYSSAVSATSISVNPQSYIGASDVPPIIANYDILFVQSKGSAIRAMTYNIYSQVFTGDDVSVMAAHLFYGYTINEWCWAEQPFYSVQAVRSDGAMLTMTYMKDQNYLGWSQYHTLGNYKSVCAVTEVLSSGVAVDAVYSVTQRTVGGNSVQYIERFAQVNTSSLSTPWCVDAGLQYNGSPTTSFTGAEHLAGLTVTGLADGLVIPPFVMPASGFFTLTTPASVVTIGLGYTCQLQTLPVDLGEPSVQGKVKKITGIDFRVVNTLGLQAGSSFSTVVNVKDLVLGNVSSALTGQPNQVITGLTTADAFVISDPTYTVPGQYCFQQVLPYPATIVGVFPRVVLEDRRGG